MKKRITFVVALVLLLTTIFVLPLTSTVKEQEEDKTIYKSSLVINDEVNTEDKIEFISKDEESTIPYKDTDIVSVTAELATASISESYLKSTQKQNLQKYISDEQTKKLLANIKNEQTKFINSLENIIGKQESDRISLTSVVMNSVSFSCEYGKLSEIKKLDNIKRIYLSIKLNPYEDIENESTPVSNNEDISEDLEETELTGSGTVTAILDTGFDTNHEIFTLDAENGKYKQDDFMYLISNLRACVSGEFAPTTLYISQKLLYAYDYVDNDTNVISDNCEHGTMVAGIIGGSTENISSASNAYNSQLLLMKCSSDSSKVADSTVILSAIEDSLILGADIINISYGSEKMLDNDFAASFNDMFERIHKCGTAVVMPAGNLGKSDSESAIEDGTASPIASLSRVISVSSAEGKNNYSPFFLYNDERIEYTLPKCSNSKSEYSFYNINDGDYDYVIYNDNLKNDGDIELKNKVIFVSDKQEDIESAINLAEQKGALALVIFGDDKTKLTETTVVPTAIVKDTSIKDFEESGGIRISTEYILISDNENYKKISSNASCGSNGSLSINPLLAETSPSYSSIPNNRYGTANGSSFSSALVSGKLALLKEYINKDKRFENYSAEQKNDLAYKLITSTADIINDRDDTAKEAVRMQGAGLVNLDNALSANAYISSGFTVLGSSDIGSYEIKLDITNITNKKITLTPSLILSSERYDSKNKKTYREDIISSNYLSSFIVDDKEVDAISIDANKTKTVTVKIKLNSAFILEQKAYFSAGFYLDGYVYFSQEADVTISSSLLGFVGSYTQESAFGSFIYDSNEKVDKQSSYLYLSTNNEEEFNYSMLLGYNKFTKLFDEKNISFNANTLKTALNNSLATNPTLYIRSLAKRNLIDFKCVIKNESGAIIYESEPFNRNRANSDEDSTSINTALSSLSNGKYILTISGKIEESKGNISEQKRSFEFNVDNKKPSKTSYKTYFADKKTYLEISGYDNNAIQGFDIYVAVYNGKTGKYEYSSSIYNLMEDAKIGFDKDSIIYVGHKSDSNGNTTFTYDITKLKVALKKLAEKYDDDEKLLKISQNKVAFAALDYAYNISDIKLCDTIVYDDLKLKFVDKNGNAISGVEAEINSKSFTSDENGKIVCANLPAGEYNVKLTNIPDKLCVEKNPFKVSTGESSENFVITIRLMPQGTYKESKDESSAIQQSGGNRDEQKPSKELNPIEQPDDADNSIYALIFVASLLAISIASFLISRKKFKH